MLIKLLKFRLALLLVTTFLLCQCTKAVNSTEPVVTVTKSKKVTSPYKIPTAEYLSKAEQLQGEEKQNLLLLAAGRMISENQWRQGLAILAQTSDLTAAQTDLKHLLLAKIDLVRDKPTAALDKLAHIKEAPQFSLYHQIDFHELLAQSYRLTGKYSQSIAERIKLETLLSDEESKTNNRRTLWLSLINIPDVELKTMAAEAADKSELQGWLQLALISHQYRTDSKSLLAALDEWQTRFNTHPANHILPNPLDSIANKMQTQPKKIALLLPLSGALSGPGNAIREGFMAAHKASTYKEATAVKLYDTDKDEVRHAYGQAIEDGADYVVGPLTKSQVASIAAMNHPVPTLLLNDSDVSAQDNSYSFGLSAANEAVQVAIKANSKGYRRALIIAPANEWGKEIAEAFSSQWQEKGGLVVDTFSYASNDDLNKKMRQFLQITSSEAREKQLKALLGQNIQITPSRRQDFDMIFLLAYPSKARQIMPLLKYYYTGDIPVYATSSAYSGSANALKDKDLEGLVFCDIPWVFSHQMGVKNWPEQFNSYNRLYALGKDSYALATQLNQLILFPADSSKDTSGIFYLKPSQQVARVLEWGQFRQGLVHSLGETG